MADIPVIDLGGRDHAKADQDIAQIIDQACCDIGFLVIRNHGVPEDIIQNCWQQSLAFFGLPLAER
ncbi:MAG: 2-oxoglutarate and iron-dependent oxygenase domain-containing protein, partial [Alphaproteobacteria bacterium]|nr:2-oxoglutarate and iron-dependent oxygenase domain-containing protein [Alphaproteobacteria bacterium]